MWAITLHSLKTEDYELDYFYLIMKSEKDFRSLKIKLINSVDDSNGGYFGLSLETLVINS